MQLLNSKVVVLVTVVAAESPPTGEDDGVGFFVSYAARMTCCVFFAVIHDAGDYPILSAYRACRDARRRVETGVSPIRKGGCGGHPFSLAYFPLCFVVVRRSLGHALHVRSLLRACHASPTEKYTALTHIARTRATDSSHTSHRLPGGVSRRRCPWHTTAASAAIN